MEDGAYLESGAYEVVLDFGSVLPRLEFFATPVEYFIYLLTPPTSPKSYVMKLPPLFQQDGFLGLSNATVSQPVQWCTYAAHESPSIVLVRVVTEHEYDLIAALRKACDWFETVAKVAEQPTNVCQMVCSREALLSLDPSGGGVPQWLYGTLASSPAPPVMFSWTLDYLDSPRQEEVIRDYSAAFFTPRDSFRTRFPIWERLHFEHHAVEEAQDGIDLVYMSPDHMSFNLEDFFGGVPPFLGLDELGQEQLLTNTSEPVPAEETVVEAKSAEPSDVNVLQVGDWVVYLDPATTSRPHTFVRTRIVGFDRSKPCWVELENNHHQTRFERGLVFFAKFNNEHHQLLTPLQPLSLFH